MWTSGAQNIPKINDSNNQGPDVLLKNIVISEIR